MGSMQGRRVEENSVIPERLYPESSVSNPVALREDAGPSGAIKKHYARLPPQYAGLRLNTRKLTLAIRKTLKAFRIRHSAGLDRVSAESSGVVFCPVL